MFKKLLVGLVVLIAAFAIYVAVQPSEYRISRSTTIDAPPAAIFTQVNDFHLWEAWSPWVKVDPNAKVTFEGPATGKDSVFRWDGNADVGTGSMTILESKPNELVRIRLDFVKPFENTATSEFTLKPEGAKTLVTWSMYGKNDFMGRAVCTVMNMDKMVGDKYAEGLAGIKQIVESQAGMPDQK